MKKTLRSLCLFILLNCSLCSAVFADTVVYETDCMATPATIGGISATVNSGNFSYGTTAVDWASDYPNYGQTTSSSGYYELEFSTPIELAADDKIVIIWGATSNRPLNMTLNRGTAIKIDAVESGSERSIVRTATYTLLSPLQLNTLKLSASGGKNVFIFRISIISSASTSTCTAPTITAQPSATDATYTQDDAATALTVSATGDNLTYQWYSNTTNSNENGTAISDATNSTYTPSTATATTTYYYCIVSSGTCTTTSQVSGAIIVNPKPETCEWSINYCAEGQTWETACFHQKDNTTEWIIENFTLPSAAYSFWVGPGEYKDYSKTTSITGITFTGLQSNSDATDYYAGENSIGTLRIYSNSQADNYYVAFIPTYQICYGKSGDNWQSEPFAYVKEDIYETELLPVPDNYATDYQFYVGPKKADGGTNFIDGKSSTLSMNTMGGLKGADRIGYYGKYRIRDTWNDANWYCLFVPYYNIRYNANGGSGTTQPSGFVSSEDTQTTLTIATNAFTAPTGKQFKEWNTQADGNGTSYIAGTATTLTDNLTLYAIYEDKPQPTGIECDVLYTAQEACAATCGTLTSTGQYKSGLSANQLFEVIGDETAEGGATGVFEAKQGSATINGQTFTTAMYFKGASQLGADKIPTSRALKFTVSDAGGITFYVRNGKNIRLLQEGGEPQSLTSETTDDKGNGFCTLSVTPGVYYLYATAGTTTFYGMQLACSCNPPVITSVSGNTVCLSDVGTKGIEVQATPYYKEGGVLSYQWYSQQDKSPVSGAEQATFLPSEAGTYYCIVTETYNGNTCSAQSEDIVFAVRAQLTVTLSTDNDTYELGTPAQPITAMAAEADTYQWYKSATADNTAGTIIQGATQSTYTPLTDALGTTYYYCTVTNDCGTASSEVLPITIEPVRAIPLFTWNYSNAASIDEGGSYDISVSVESDGVLSLEMLKTNGVSLSPVASAENMASATFEVAAAKGADTLRFVAKVTETTETHAGTDTLLLLVNTCSTELDIPVMETSINAGSGASPRYYWETEGVGLLTRKFGGSDTPSEPLEGVATYEGFSLKAGDKATQWLMQLHKDNVERVRLYVYNTNELATLVACYLSDNAPGKTSDMTKITPSAVTYADGKTGVETDTHGYIEILLPTPLKKNQYLLFEVSQNVSPLGVRLFLPASTGELNPVDLKWKTDVAELTVPEGTPPFYYKAITTSNTLGEITYTSSNTDVATVDATTGTVNVLTEGLTTITATLAPSGCYAGAAVSYTLTVEQCSDKKGTIAITQGTAAKCTEDEVTLTLTDYEDGAQIEWYKDNVLIEGETSHTLTLTEAGEYYAVTTLTCVAASNVIYITNLPAPEVSSLVGGYWYLKDGRITPDAELFSVEYATEWSCTPATVAGCRFEKGDDNIVRLVETPQITTQQDVEVILTANNTCSDNKASDRITFRLLPATAKPTLAFITIGTEGKGFTEGIAANQSTDLKLYKALQEYFDITATNAYASTDELLLASYYSQFDIILLTDYPNTLEKDEGGHSYSNAIGCLIDRVPILSLETFVANLPNWHLSSNPKDPEEHQTQMTLLCPAHEIFGNTHGEGDIITMITGVATGGKGLQGFDAQLNTPDYVYIATINGGTQGTLITCCERQVDAQARMILLGLNETAMENITDDGTTIVRQVLQYLLKKDVASLADCAVVFDNKNGTGKWSDPVNWAPAYNAVPSPYQATRIEQPCIVDIPDAHASSVKLCKDDTRNGKLTITPTGGLTVINFIKEVRGNNYITAYPITASDLRIQASATGTGALAVGTPDNHLQATVQFYSIASGAPANAVWQYVGAPFSNMDNAVTYYRNAWMCRWTETPAEDLGANWEFVRNEDYMQPFHGYSITQVAAKTYEFQGILNATADRKLPLTFEGTGEYKGWNLLANSWLAPIEIKTMNEDDFGGAEATVYIYNAGTYDDWKNNTSDVAQSVAGMPGQYTAIPVGAAGVMEEVEGQLTTIPPLQGFFVITALNTHLSLEYDRMVFTDDYSLTTKPLRAPAKTKANTTMPEYMVIDVQGEYARDRLWLLQDEAFSIAFDNGYDGRKLEGETFAPQLYAQTEDGDMAICALPDWSGTTLAFRKGTQDMQYTLSFIYDGEPAVLYDLKTGAEVAVKTGNTYSFFATEDQPAERFRIIKKSTEGGDTPTSVLDAVYAQGGLQISNLSGTEIEVSIYNPEGKLIEQFKTTASLHTFSMAQQGVYMVRLRSDNESKVVKIIL